MSSFWKALLVVLAVTCQEYCEFGGRQDARPRPGEPRVATPPVSEAEEPASGRER